MKLDHLISRNVLPDFLLRFGIRRLLTQRLIDETAASAEEQQKKLNALIEFLKSSPIAVNTPDANEQHYEVPAEFFQLVLGKNLKYSCGYWDTQTTDLNKAETDMLRLTCQRAGIQNGERIIELGCGWGSLTLYIASNFPQCHITGVSNSNSQREFIMRQAELRGLPNIRIITADMNNFETTDTFDRAVSVEMFEHMRNYDKLLKRISGFLKPTGELFVHIFTHKNLSYLFEVKDETDWMSKYFFTGGIMPSDNLLLHFANDFSLHQHWIVDGTHYQKTAEAWLQNMDAHQAPIMDIFTRLYGRENALRWWVNWRIFFMACAELWGYNQGNEWFVSHYLFQKRKIQ